MNIRNVFYSLFRSSVQKSERCPFIFLFFKLLATGNPDRKDMFQTLKYRSQTDKETADALFRRFGSFYFRQADASLILGNV